MLAQQSNNTNHTKTQPSQNASNQTKNNRRKNTTSTKNSRGSKSFNGDSMHSMNTHRNIPTTPTVQQTHNGYFQSQSITFFHSAASNGMQQIFSSAISPSSQSQHSNQSVGVYVPQNSTSAYPPNNNYHSHNRNYNNNNSNGKKHRNYYGKSKSEMNGNYSSSNSSTTSSTHSTGKTNSRASPVSSESSVKKANPTTPTIQQTHNGYFQSQSIPSYHSAASNGMQQIFSSAISPNNQSQQSNQSVNMYMQQNSTSAYHPNNNYHSHNRNYNNNNNNNNGGSKKYWNYYGKSKSEMNSNYSSSNSSTTSSTHSTGKPNSRASPVSSESSLKKANPMEKSHVKKLANKSTQVESSHTSLKTFSLSDSETCNSKVKQGAPNEYFRFPKSKAASSPVISTNSATHQSGKNSPSISHSFLAAIDKDTLKNAGVKPEQPNVPFEKPEKSSFDSSQLAFPQNQRNVSMPSRYINTGSMYTEEMLLLNGSLSRLRYMNAQNMHLLGDANIWTANHLQGADCYSTSRKNFMPGVPQTKRRSGGTSSSTATRKTYDFESRRAQQYRDRLRNIITPANLLNGSEWDEISQKIWAKFEKRRQPTELFDKKIALWTLLSQQIKKILPRYSLYLVGSTVSGFALDSSDVDMCLVSRLSTNMDHRAEAVQHLTHLRGHLQDNCQSLLRNFNLIPAKVPILRFDDFHHNIEVDLNYNNCVGIRNSHLLYCYSQLDWRLQPLAVIVKLWAQHHDINNAKDLTISSYSLILMVIHYLQVGATPAILPCLHTLYPDKFNKINDIETINMSDVMDPYHSDNNQTLGELFHGFLEYFVKFRFDKFAICVRTAGVLPVEECRNHLCFKNDPTEWKQLCIEEPFDRSNTARSCCDEKIFERIKRIIHKSYRLLDETKDIDKLFGEPLEPPVFCTFFDNYAPLVYHPVDYIIR